MTEIKLDNVVTKTAVVCAIDAAPTGALAAPAGADHVTFCGRKSNGNGWG